jgi:transposase
MALGKHREEQQEMWVATTSLPKSVGHVFYRKLNRLLAEADFDRTVEEMCEPYYHAHLGRPSIPPGVYFRMLLIGYYEGIGSQRGIAWRCADSLSLREFLGIPLTEETPDHSSLTRVRDRLPLETHAAVFQWVLALAAEKKLLPGKTVAVDATTLEADAAMKSIVRRDTGEDWNEYLRRLMKEREGVENPTDEEIRRFDKQRKDKRVSNNEWVSETDPDSRITKMKDGTTHLAYKAEHVVDLKTELVLAASIRHADEGDADTMVDSIVEARVNLSEAGVDVEIEEAVADKGYHATDTIELAESLGVRTYIPERKIKGKRNWRDVSEEKRRAFVNNRRRVRGARSKRLQRLRSELVERSFAHVCDTGGARRSWLHGIEKVQKGAVSVERTFRLQLYVVGWAKPGEFGSAAHGRMLSPQYRLLPRYR